MFGLFNKKKSFLKQFSRAVSIENVLKVGVMEYQLNFDGYNCTENEPPESKINMYCSVVNYIFCGAMDDSGSLSNNEEISRDNVVSTAQKLLASDIDLERVIVRTLFDIFSFSLLIDKDNWSNDILADHPRLMEVVSSYKNKYPELYSDVTEREFKLLFERFIKKYSPNLKDATSHLFL